VKEQKLFLIDGFGALISMFSLGFVLVLFNEYIGMPVNVLYVLAAFAAVFMTYSFTCFAIVPKKPKPLLQIIGIANLSYSLATLLLMFFHWSTLVTLGKVYFIGEVLIIWVLAYREIK